MQLKNYIIILKLLAIIFVTTLNSFAQETEVKNKMQKDIYLTKPTLNGHSFSNISSLKSPFINSSFNIIVGAGQSVGFELPAIEIDTFKFKPVKGDVAFSVINFEYKAKLRDWLSFWIDFQLNGRLGTELRSVFSQGVNVSTGYEFGWLFKLWENHKNMLSGAVKVVNMNYSVIDLKGYVENIIQTGEISDNNILFQSVPSLSFSGELRHAVAFNKSLGLSSYIEFGAGEPINRDEDLETMLLLGVAADYDLLPKSDIPIGFSLGYFQNSKPKLSDERFTNPQNIISKISYTGSKDMNAGIEISYEWSKPNVSNTDSIILKFVNIYGNFRYYF